MMPKFKIFVSAVQKELTSERRAVKDFVLADPLLSEYFDVFLFEDASAKSKSAEQSFLEEVRKSDVYIGILGDCYGSVGKDKLSPTEKEFREARKEHKEILIYIKGENSRDQKRDGGVKNLIEEIRDAKQGFSYKRFKKSAELTHLIHASLIDFLKEEGIVGRGAFDEQICKRATLKDIDSDKVRWFLEIAKAARKYPLKKDSSVETVLIHLDLMKEGKLTNAAVLLFGKKPHHYFPQAEVKCLQFSGTEVKKPFRSYQVYNGNLFEQVDKALSFALDSIKFPVIQKSGSARFDRPFEIPEFAIQEAIVNAVAHRNYNVTSGVQVMVFADRLEVWNSGSLPPELTVEDLKKPHTSFPANQLLANALYLADYAQRAGSGTLAMIDDCNSHGAPEPDFVTIRNKEFRTILPRDVFTEDVLSKLGLNERQLEAVKYIKNHTQINNQIYQDINKTNKRTASRDLTDLVRRAVFSRDGNTGKGTFYTLKTKGPQTGQRGHQGDIKVPKKRK